MKDISSPSASTTTSGADGPPPTGQNSESTSIHPHCLMNEKEQKEVEEFITRLYPGSRIMIINGRGQSPIWFRRRLWVAKARHLVGLHTFVDCSDVDMSTGSIKFSGRVCLVCETAARNS